MISAVEIFANGMITASIFLAGRNNIHTWWVGIVGCLAFAFVFRESRLYADVTLQFFFIATSMIGWRQWLHGDRGRALRVSHGNFAVFAWAALLGVMATFGYGALLHFHTDAYAPFVDSAVLAFSVIAQIFLMRRRVEAWLFWLLVNTVAVPLYASRGLYLTSILYAAYWVNAIISWRLWRRLSVSATGFEQ
ncbi:MAG: nicotinamide riboside transporter PnuC [Azoarcus sp.]|jgi:nicotinamide mononucleotide transporter|nr:nicotinamide riboside transporter PnuC [Azoarcus sp.]